MLSRTRVVEEKRSHSSEIVPSQLLGYGVGYRRQFFIFDEYARMVLVQQSKRKTIHCNSKGERTVAAWVYCRE